MRRPLSAVALVLFALVLAGCSAPITGPGSPTPEAPAPAAVASAPATPTLITIPELGVSDEIVPVGLADDGTLQIPDVRETGWFSGSPVPGTPGPALLASHVNYKGTVGALARIGGLKPGDRIEVGSASGATAVFVVYNVSEQHKTAINWVSVLADRPAPELVIVTCSGRLIGHSYEDNTVVSARIAT